MSLMRLEEKLRLAIENNIPEEELTIACLELIEKTSVNWVAQYLSAIYLWKYSNENSQNDNKIMETLENLINKGLTLGKDKEAFIQSSLILSQLHFKYGRYRHASNYLLLLRENENTNTPSWIYNFSAKLYYKMDLASAVTNPSTIIKYLELSTTHSGHNIDSQAQAVFREYLADSLEYLISINNDFNVFTNFIHVIQPCIEKFNVDSSEEWSKLLNQYSEINKLSFPSGDTKTLEAENRMLLGLLGERTKLIQQQSSEITALRIINQELRDNINEITSHSVINQKEIINKIREEIGINDNECKTIDRIKILILGTPQISEKQIWGIAATLGIEKEQLELHLDYSENKRFDLDKLRYNSPFSGILVGPIAHKIVGLGDHTSVIQKMQKEDGFPPVVEIRTHSGELKITKSSLRDALGQILNIINANIPV